MAFNSGKPQNIAKINVLAESANLKDILGDYVQLDQKLHTTTRNLLIVPIKLGNNAVGCIEVANKRGGQELTDQDLNMLEMLSEEMASGLISYEMKHNIKKELEDEVKYGKSLFKQTYNSFLLPIL